MDTFCIFTAFIGVPTMRRRISIPTQRMEIADSPYQISTRISFELQYRGCTLLGNFVRVSTANGLIKVLSKRQARKADSVMN